MKPATLIALFALILLVYSNDADAQEQPSLVQQTEQLMSNGQWAPALETIDKAIAANESDAWSHVLRGQILDRIDRDNDALECFSRAIQLAPNQPRGYVERAKLALRLRLLAQALADCDKVLEFGIQMHEVRGYAHFYNNEFIKAITGFSELISEQSGSDDVDQMMNAHFMRGRALFELGTYDLAASEFARSQDLVQDLSNVVWLARANMKAENYSAAIKQFTEFIDNAAPESTADAHMMRARCLFESGQLEASLKDIAAGEAIAPNDPEIIKMADLGRQKVAAAKQNPNSDDDDKFPANARLLEFQKQLKALSDQTQIDALVKSKLESMPTTADDAATIAWLHSVKQNLPEALKAYSHALELDPSHAESLIARSILYEALMGTEHVDETTVLDKILADIDKLMAIDHPYGYEHRASMYRKIQSFPKAMMGFSLAKRMNKNNPDKIAELTNMRADLLFDIKAYDLALTEFERSVELGYSAPGSRVSLGILHQGKNQWKKTIQDFTFEIEHEATNPMYFVSRGYAYEMTGQIQEATADYQMAAKISEPGSQANTIATNSLQNMKFRSRIRSFLALIEKGGAAQLKTEFSSAIAEFLDNNQLEKRMALFNQRVENLGSSTWQDFEKTEPGKTPPTVTIQLDDPDKSTITIQMSEDDKIYGIRFDNETFHFDTYDAIGIQDTRTAIADSFWTDVYSGKTKEAHDTFTQGDHSLLPIDPFTQSVEALLSGKDNIKLTGLESHQARIRPLSEATPYPGIDIYHLAEINDSLYNPCRFTFENFNDEWRPANFKTGTVVGAYPHRNFEYANSFFKALSSGKPQELINIVHPSDQSAIVPEILMAFQGALKGRFGEFEQVDLLESSAHTWHEDEVRNSIFRGVAKFEKGNVKFRLNTSYGTLDNYSLTYDEVLDWVGQIKDFERLENYGSDFLIRFINSPAEEVKENLSNAWDHLTTDNVKRIQTAVRSEIGKVESVTVTGKTYDKENYLWKIDYLVKGEKGELPGDVSFSFTMTDASVNGFHFHVD